MYTEGTLVLKKGTPAIRYFAAGDINFIPLTVGMEIELLLNDHWVKTQVISITDEPYFPDLNYGDGIGCEARTIT